jgi:hypothetical protein
MFKAVLGLSFFVCLIGGGYLLRDIDLTQVVGAALVALAVVFGACCNEC